MELCAAQKNSAQRAAKERRAPLFRPFPTLQLAIFLSIIGKSGAVFTKHFCHFSPGPQPPAASHNFPPKLESHFWRARPNQFLLKNSARKIAFLTGSAPKTEVIQKKRLNPL